MTEGFFPLATFSAIFSPAHAGRPTAAAAVVQTLMKSRRENPFVSSPNTSEPISFIPSSGWRGDHSLRTRIAERSIDHSSAERAR